MFFQPRESQRYHQKTTANYFLFLENCCLIFQPCRFFKSSFLAFTIFCVADKLRGKPNIFTFQTLSCEIKRRQKNFSMSFLMIALYRKFLSTSFELNSKILFVSQQNARHFILSYKQNTMMNLQVVELMHFSEKKVKFKSSPN